MDLKNAYNQLLQLSLERSHLGSAVALLHWDQRTQIPAKGHGHRINVLSTFARMYHQMAVKPLIGELLGYVADSDLVKDPLSVEAVNIRDWKRSYERATKIPEDLAVAVARACAEGQSVWEKARPANDWLTFMPYLNRIVELKRQEAEALGYETNPYDALLDGYERGETAEALKPIFKTFVEGLMALLDKIRGSSKKIGADLKFGHFPIEAQKAFALNAVKQMGYDLDGGRLDVSAHPFTTGIGPGDVRITTRYTEEYFNEAFFAVVHEAGHAMYHQGLPFEHYGTPFCSPVSLGIHESQSRMWENVVARSRAFWNHFYPKAQAAFPCLAGVPVDDFYFSVNEVTPSLIRVEADEVTYNMHILLRFDLEDSLMSGELNVKDLPDAWNQKMESYLGIVPPDPSRGVMQDVHWSSGNIGYFPTYTLGNLYAAQFFNKAEADLGDLQEQISGGKFGDLLQWLRTNIHSQGGRYLPRDLLKQVTNENLNPDYLINYMNNKYLELYGM